VKVLSRERLSHMLSPNLPPVAEIKSGETIAVETEDTFCGRVRQPEEIEDFLAFLARSPGPDGRFNPVIGPISIVGAEPGDAIAITVGEIELDSQGATCFRPGVGSFPDWFDEPQAKILPIKEGFIQWDERIRIPTKPMIGLLGVAPPYESLATGKAGTYGGNMDCEAITTGNTLLLPVYHPGALLYVGDVHAVQGDSEFSWVAVEARARVILSVDVVKGRPSAMTWPRVYTPKSITTIVSARPLDEALAGAYREMILWLEEEFGFDRGEAYMLLGQVADGRICNMFTARCVFPRCYLPEQPTWPRN
jgi:acetamidase/formamidase